MKLEQITQKVIDCKTVEEVITVVEGLDSIEGSNHMFTGKEMAERIRLCAYRSYPLNYMTRSHGIRAKVMELMHYGKYELPVSKKNI